MQDRTHPLVNNYFFLSLHSPRYLCLTVKKKNGTIVSVNKSKLEHLAVESMTFL